MLPQFEIGIRAYIRLQSEEDREVSSDRAACDHSRFGLQSVSELTRSVDINDAGQIIGCLAMLPR